MKLTRRLKRAVMTIVVLSLGVGHAQSQQDDTPAVDSAVVTVGELSNRTPAQLQQDKQAALEKRKMVATLLQNAADKMAEQAQSAEEEKSVTVKPQVAARSNEKRENELSNGYVPRRMELAAAQREFLQLKDRISAGVGFGVVLDELSAFVDQHERLREPRITLARLFILDEQHEVALETLQPLTSKRAQLSHPDWQSWFWAGTAHLALGDIERARDSLDVAVTKNGAVAEVWIQLAVLEQEQTNHAGALQYIAIAEQLDPNSAEVHLNKAYSLEHLGRYAEALKAYQRFLVSEMNMTVRSVRPLVLRRIAEIAAAVEPAELS